MIKELSHVINKYAFIFVSLVKRQFTIKYARAILGITWLFLPPIILTGIFYSFLGAQLVHETPNYLIFLFSGFVLWGLFSNGMNSTSNSIVSNTEILKKIYIPRIIFPLSIAVASLIEFAILFLVFSISLLFYDIEVVWHYYILNSIGATVITFLTLLGGGLVFTSLSVKFRDMLHALPFVVQVVMFASPVIIPLSFIQNNSIRTFLSLNPISGALKIFRNGIFNTPTNSSFYLTHLGISAVILLIGIYIFKKKEPSIVDHI